MQIDIHNAEQSITRTSYWRTPHARRGLLYLSVNAGAIRVLVPDAIRRELLSGLPPVGRPVTITRGEWQRRATYVLQWDEPAETGLEPYSIDIDQEQSDRRWPSAEDGRIVPLIWYTAVGVWGVHEARREQVQIGEVVAS